MAKKKLTINQQQWKKEMKRIERFQREATKRGFYFPDDILPQQPKRITKKSLEKLANITPEKQYAKAVYLDKDTGKMVSGTEGRKIERSRASKKGWQGRKYKATPRPRPTIDRPDEPTLKGGEAEKGLAGQPLDVNSLIHAMDRALENLNFKNGKVELEVELETKTLQSVWNSTKARFKDHKELLESYLAGIDFELQHSLDVIQHESDSNVVRQAMNRLLELLNYNIPLSTESLKEFESEYTDIDLTDYDLPYTDE